MMLCFGRGKTKKEKQRKAFERGYNADREAMIKELESELATRLCCSTKPIMLHYSVYAASLLQSRLVFLSAGYVSRGRELRVLTTHSSPH